MKLGVPIPLLLYSLAVCQSVCAQNFDVASIKILHECPRVRVHDDIEPARIVLHCSNIRDLVWRAYPDYADRRIVFPAWLDADPNYEVQVTMPAATSKDQLQAMFRSLLINRFGLLTHVETHGTTVYQVTISTKGSKLHAVDDPGLPAGFEMHPADPRGWRFPMLLDGDGPEHRAAAYKLGQLFSVITGFLLREGYPMLNKTGLDPDGWYDTPFFIPFGVSSDPASVNRTTGRIPAQEDVIGAVEKQLGLRIEKTTVPLEVLVIDDIKKTPTEN